MSNSEPTGPSGENTSDNEPELLDINGNPIPRNWDPTTPPAPPDAEPPSAKPSGPGNSNGSRPSNGVHPAAPGSRPAPTRPLASPSLMPGEEERLDLAGRPLPPLKASLSPPPPAYRSPGTGSSSAKSGGGNPLAPIFAIALLLLIAGAGYVIYTKYTANQKNLAKSAAASSASSKAPTGPKTHAAHKKPFGGTN